MDGGKKYSYFCHRECEYFPCHEGLGNSFNCLFCFCPLYPMGDACPGDYSYTAQGVKDCSGCTFPHVAGNYEAIMTLLGGGAAGEKDGKEKKDA